MSRIFTLLFFLLIAQLSQGQYLKMATISSWGGGTISSGNYLSQVVGQSSVIAGTESQQGIVFRQGFKQPMSLQKKTQSNSTVQLASEGTPWSFQAYPNPFKDALSVRFDQNTTLPTRLILYDTDAKIIWEQSYPDNQSEIKLDQFQGIKAGKYILQVFQKGKPQTQSLIKEIN
jgi:hypothetical protein